MNQREIDVMQSVLDEVLMLRTEVRRLQAFEIMINLTNTLLRTPPDEMKLSVDTTYSLKKLIEQERMRNDCADALDPPKRKNPNTDVAEDFLNALNAHTARSANK